MAQTSVIICTDSPNAQIPTLGVNGHDVEAILLLRSDGPINIVVRSTNMGGTRDDDSELIGPRA